MPYCTLDSIEAPEKDLIELTDDAGIGVIDQAVVDKAIAHADELIDGYLRGRYPLPLNPVPGLIAALSADISLYRLYGRRPRLSIPESLSDKYKNALKLLDNIQKGQITLGIGGVPEQEIPAPAASLVKTPTRIFNDDLLDTY
jgi:phage gp36-like protein